MIAIRAAVGGDRRLLEEMLALAADWSSDEARPVAEVMADPRLAHYVEGWPVPDGFGVVAEDGARPVGAAWCRQLTAEDPGWGYVSDDVPEMAIAVVPGRRGEGIGADLVAALVDEAKRRGVRAISLSVEQANPAARLYERLGFVVVARSDTDLTMVLELA